MNEVICFKDLGSLTKQDWDPFILYKQIIQAKNKRYKEFLFFFPR